MTLKNIMIGVISLMLVSNLAYAQDNNTKIIIQRLKIAFLTA